MSLSEINLSYVLQVSMAPELTFLEEGLAVITPRQLAPTVGQEMRGVEIVGAARRAMEKLADRKSTRLNSSHSGESRMPSSA